MTELHQVVDEESVVDQHDAPQRTPTYTNRLAVVSKAQTYAINLRVLGSIPGLGNLICQNVFFVSFSQNIGAQNAL